MERLFRTEAGRLVASLTRRLGSARLALVEDVVQDALVTALEQWPFSGIPDEPSAWLRRVALNRAIDALRRRTRFDSRATRIARALEDELRGNHPGVVALSPLADEELRMVLLCCHPALTRPVRVALSLKMASGFGISEIARALLSSERAVAQRLVRAKRQLRALRVSFELPAGRALTSRVDAALDVVYLLFNEGYGAHAGENLTRADLCREALRLGGLIAGAPAVATPRAHALLALMAFHAARLPSRINGDGELVRLDDQDRARWDPLLVKLGFSHLDQSMSGDVESAFHLQASIAAVHASAQHASATDWLAILELYDRLLALEPTPVVRLNRAVAVARVHGARAGLRVLEPLARHPAMRDYYLLPAVRADLLAMVGRRVDAKLAYRQALRRPCSMPERRFIESRLAQLKGRNS
jgi:RNA polymerase sigma-70 factor (ECF subfamily)